MRAFAAASVLLIALAGCAGTTPDDSATGPIEEPATIVAAPKVEARATLDALRLFSAAYPYRQANTQAHVDSRAWLEKQMADAGLEVLRHKFGAYENIVGIKWGLIRDEWIVVGSHYDVTEGALHGTYDDGSGTLMTVRLAQAFAKIETDRTLAFIPFDQEERGLVGSKAFVKDVQEAKLPWPVTVVAMVDLDMIGITWPHPADLVCWENSDEVKALLEDARKAAGVPDANVQYRKSKGGTSDGVSFMRAGIPTTYCWSNWDEVVLKDGTPWTGSYPWWHQADTYDTMLAMAGDEATLQAGFQTVLDIMSPVLAKMSERGREFDVRQA